MSKKYLGLFGKKQLTSEEYHSICRNIDKATGKMGALEQQMRARKSEMKSKGVDALKSQDEGAFGIYSMYFQSYANKEKQLSEGKTTLDMFKVQIEDAYIAQKVDEVLDNVKNVTGKVTDATGVYEKLENMQANLRETMNTDGYQSKNKDVYLQDWQLELRSQWEAEIEAGVQAGQGLEEKVKKKKSDTATVETGT